MKQNYMVCFKYAYDLSIPLDLQHREEKVMSLHQFLGENYVLKNVI